MSAPSAGQLAITLAGDRLGVPFLPLCLAATLTAPDYHPCWAVLAGTPPFSSARLCPPPPIPLQACSGECWCVFPELGCEPVTENERCASVARPCLIGNDFPIGISSLSVLTFSALSERAIRTSGAYRRQASRFRACRAGWLIGLPTVSKYWSVSPGPTGPGLAEPAESKHPSNRTGCPYTSKTHNQAPAASSKNDPPFKRIAHVFVRGRGARSRAGGGEEAAGLPGVLAVQGGQSGLVQRLVGSEWLGGWEADGRVLVILFRFVLRCMRPPPLSPALRPPSPSADRLAVPTRPTRPPPPLPALACLLPTGPVDLLSAR